ncbi:MAG: hypothetical protein AAF763_00865 [Pseudomonadota bacterium]
MEPHNSVADYLLADAGEPGGVRAPLAIEDLRQNEKPTVLAAGPAALRRELQRRRAEVVRQIDRRPQAKPPSQVRRSDLEISGSKKLLSSSASALAGMSVDINGFVVDAPNF